MSILSQFSTIVGPLSKADGAYVGIRSDKQGCLVVTPGHGKYNEPATRGVLFAACEQGSGITLATSISTTAALVLYNPQGSTKRLSLCKVALGYISGTLVAGTIYHCVNTSTTQTAPSSGTLLTAVCSDIGNANTPSGVVRVAATVVAPVAFRPFVISNAMLASTATNPVTLWEDLNGEIVLEPGTSYQIQAVAAGGSTPKITAGISWEEIPLV